MRNTFFFYDLETSGLSPRTDRIMQFAGQRTDMDLNPIGEPYNILIKLSKDTLPSPTAILTTKITPQKTLEQGITEAEFAHLLQSEIFTSNTCAVGYNNISFDDEFIRYLFWRNFHDPYEWHWKDGRSRWDILNLVRLTRALRPDGINWPTDQDNKPTNRLEFLTKSNNITHKHAHDALSDVFATISVAKLIKSQKPQLFSYLFSLRDKKQVQKLVNLENPKPFLITSTAFKELSNSPASNNSNQNSIKNQPSAVPSPQTKPSKKPDYLLHNPNYTTVAFPFSIGKNGNPLIFNLRYNLEELQSDPPEYWFGIVETLAYNKCPAVAPLSVLQNDSDWQKIALSSEKIQENLKTLLKHPEFSEKMRLICEEPVEWGDTADSESALYKGFLNDSDRLKCNAVRNADANKLADFHPNFSDQRLESLLVNYKARNFPTALSDYEVKIWEKYRQNRLQTQSAAFLAELQNLTSTNIISGSHSSNPTASSAHPSLTTEELFVLEELSLWYQSLLPEDY